MKKIFLFLAACAMSIGAFAAVSITITPNNVDFGEVSIKGKASVEGSVTFDVTYSGLPQYCGVVFEDAEMPEDGAAFWIEGTNTDGWIYSGDQYNPAEGEGLTLHYMADKAGTYTGKIRFYSYNSEDDWYNDVPGTSYYMTMKLVVTDEAIVAKTTPFERVNSTGELKDGDVVVFVNEASGAVSGPLSDTYLPAVTEGVKIDKTKGTADVPENAQTFVMKKYSGNWQFIYPDDSDKALLLDYDANDGKGAFSTTYTAGKTVKSWEITISNGVASVIRPNDADPAYPIRFNSDRFKPYKNEGTGTDITLYKKAGEAQEIQSSLTVTPSPIAFTDCEMGEQQSVEVSYTAENLTDDIVWAVEGTDAVLFDVTDNGNRESGKLTITYKGTGTQIGAVSAQLSYLTRDAKLDPMEGSFPISLNLLANTVKLTKIEFVGAPETIDQGQSIDLAPFVKLTPEDAADKSLTWATDHDYQGTITEAGVLTAKHVTGKIVVTVTSVRVPEVSATHTLTITVPTITDFTLSDSEVTLNIGGTKTLSVTAFVPEYASATATFASSNTDVATVNKNGLITAKAIGDAEITATIGEVVKTCAVHVVPVTINSISFDPAEVSLTLGSTLQLNPITDPAEAAEQYTIGYESDNEAVATVDANGKVTSHAEGDAVITATIADKSAQITIHVVGMRYFTKVTSAASLTAKDTIILANATPMIAGAVNTDKNCLTAVTEGVTVTADAAGSDDALVFILGGTTGKFTLTALSTGKLLSTSDGTKLAYGTKNTTWLFEAEATGVMVKNTGYDTKVICYNGQSKYIRLYAPGTSSTPLYVYVRKYIEPETPQGIEDVEAGAKAQKILRNGQILILRNGEVYTVDGKKAE